MSVARVSFATQARPCDVDTTTTIGLQLTEHDTLLVTIYKRRRGELTSDCTFVAHEVLLVAICEVLVEHTIQTACLILISVDAVLDVLGRIACEVICDLVSFNHRLQFLVSSQET